MITSGSVGGIYLPEMTDEIVGESMIRSGNKREIIVTEDLLKKGSVLAPWNKKRGIYVRTRIEGGVLNVWHKKERRYIETQVGSLKELVLRKMNGPENEKEKKLQDLMQRRFFPFFILEMVFPEADHGEWVETEDG